MLFFIRWGFIIIFCRFHPPYLKHKNYNEVVVKQIDEQICVHVNLFLNKFLQEPEFYQVYTFFKLIALYFFIFFFIIC